MTRRAIIAKHLSQQASAYLGLNSFAKKHNMSVRKLKSIFLCILKET